MSMPSYGQRSDPRAAPDCPRHPGVRSVDYCKRCNRPMCVDCAIPTEVRSICVDCTSSKRGWARQASRAAAAGAPVVTYAMMAICVLVYALTLLAPSVGASLALVPALLASHPWMILTQAFVHIGFFHIVFNMLTLYVVGRSIEPVLGWWRYLIVYLVSALGGSAFILAWCLLQPQYAFASAAGASAGVFGLFGAIFVLQRLGGADTRPILVLLGINLVFGFLGSAVAWQLHLGGAIAGVGATWLLVRLARPRAGVTEAAQNRRQALVALGMIAGMIAVNSLAFRVLLEVHGA